MEQVVGKGNKIAELLIPYPLRTWVSGDKAGLDLTVLLNVNPGVLIDSNRR
jgi:hypothetical protein